MARQPSGKGKLEFVKRTLLENPQASLQEINHAWAREGNEGTISRSSIAKVRSGLGPTLQTRAEEPSRTVASRPTRGTAELPSGSPASENGRPDAGLPETDRSRLIEELECDLDRILFRAMDRGDMPEFERQIRRCRRLLILGSGE